MYCLVKWKNSSHVGSKNLDIIPNHPMYKPSQHTSKQKWWFDFGPKKRTRAVEDPSFARKKLDFPHLLWRCFIEAWELSVQLRVPTLLAGGDEKSLQDGELAESMTILDLPLSGLLVANKGWDMLGFQTLYWESCHPGGVDGIPGGWGVNPMIIMEMLWFSHLTSNCTTAPYENEAFATWNCKKFRTFF